MTHTPWNRRSVLRAAFGLCALCRASASQAQAPSSTAADSGRIILHLLERPIGSEDFVLRSDSRGLTLTTRMAYVDRGTRIALEASLLARADGTPLHFRAEGKAYRFVNVDVEVRAVGRNARVRNMDDSSVVPLPAAYFPARSYAPLAGRALLIRYWERHGRPRKVRALPGDAGANIAVAFLGVDTVSAGAQRVVLRRYAVDGVVWGREAVWVDGEGRVAAVLTRVHILPLEGVREELRAALPQLQAIAVRDRMRDVQRLTSDVLPVASGAFALTGARVVDGTGRRPLLDATVLVRDGRVEAVGGRAEVAVPPGVRVIDARGKTIIPGLWDMHAHVSQIEWGAAYLAAGVTTVRDMGGETRFLTAYRDVVDSGATGPRLLLGALVDGDAPDAFGTNVVSTPAGARAAVDSARALGFRQIKVYGRVAAAEVGAITRRAHELGMTVTGHVPAALGLAAAVDSGFDGVEHLPLGDAASPEGKALIARLAQRHTVVDPTMAWNELLGRASDVNPVTFEPGMREAPVPLVHNYESVRNAGSAASAAADLKRGLDAVKAMNDAGVTLIAGTDGGLPGYSLLRVLELYGAAGFAPLEAIRSATAVPAAVMGIADAGTVQAGKRADLLVLDGDPLADIANIRLTRWVIARGRMYESRALWAAAGFRPRPR